MSASTKICSACRNFHKHCKKFCKASAEQEKPTGIFTLCRAKTEFCFAKFSKHQRFSSKSICIFPTHIKSFHSLFRGSPKKQNSYFCIAGKAANRRKSTFLQEKSHKHPVKTNAIPFLFFNFARKIFIREP